MTIIAHTIRKKYETTFPPNEISPIFLGSNNFDTCINDYASNFCFSNVFNLWFYGFSILKIN